MVVSPSTFPSFGQDDFLAFVQDFHQYLLRFCVPNNGSQRNVYVYIITVRAMLVLPATSIAVTSNYVSGIFQVKQRPMLGVASNDHVTSTASITTVGPSLCRHSIPHEMCRTRSATSRAATNLYVINEVFT
jgi:hypothetical protein